MSSMGERYEIAAERKYVQAGPTRLSYLDWGGTGPPALLLHGITSDAMAMWRAAPALRDAGYHVLAMDMPGHGESDVSADHAIDTVAGLAGALILALGLGDVALIGHSWGGATALALAGGEHPARAALARVALIDPALAMSAEWGRGSLPSYLDGVGAPASEEARARIRRNNPAWLPMDVALKAAALERVRAEQVRGFFTPQEDWTLVPRAARVAVPLLVLVADPAHTVIPPERLDDLRAALAPGLGSAVVIPGTNHNMLRGPGFTPTMEALLGWLAR